MTTIFDILQQLSSTASRKEKESILEINKDNETLKNVIRLALDPYTNFYIKKIPQYKKFEGPELSLELAMNMLHELSDRVVTGNAAIDYLSNILSKCSEDNAYVIKCIIEKDLKCGVSTSTVNKVFGKNFVTEYPVMLCEQFDMKYVNKLQWDKGVRVDLKEDGCRVNIQVEGDKISFFSRKGRLIETHGVFDAQVLSLATQYITEDGKAFVLDCVFDGELLAVDERGILLPRKESNGICNKAIKGTLSKKEAEQLRVSLWDIIPLHHFKEGHCEAKLSQREDLLVNLFKIFSEHCSNPKITLTPYVYVKSLEEAENIFKQYLEQGKEGIIIKNPESPWEDKRSQHFIKMKSEKECELRVIDVVEGEGKYKGKMGALTCTSECGNVIVNVGSGFKDIDREKNWELGSIITVKYNEKIADKNGNYSLFLPIYQNIRFDKDIANTLGEIE